MTAVQRDEDQFLTDSGISDERLKTYELSGVEAS
jgi:hypothetical protein